MRLAFVLSLLLFAPRSPAPVNAVAGDASWIAAHGSPPIDVPEDERIATHLLWVEAQLRAATPALSPAARAARAQLLDVLHGYALARAFPRHDGPRDGRAPRWVDSEGRHCAVAALVEASGDGELVRTVQRDHEYDEVPDMDEPALLTWADAHGFTIAELALIQPTYDDGGVDIMPESPREARARMARERRAAARPRPLTRDQVRAVLDGYVVAARPTCGATWAGHLRVATTLRIDTRRRVEATVSVMPSGAGTATLEACLSAAAQAAMTAVIGSANHRVARPIEEAAESSLDVSTRDEVAAALVSDTRPFIGETRQAALARCMVGASAPRTVPLRIAGWNGQVSLRWPELGYPTLPAQEMDRWYCIQSVITYGQLSAYGVADIDVDLTLSLEGTLGPVRAE